MKLWKVLPALLEGKTIVRNSPFNHPISIRYGTLVKEVPSMAGNGKTYHLPTSFDAKDILTGDWEVVE